MASLIRFNLSHIANGTDQFCFYKYLKSTLSVSNRQALNIQCAFSIENYSLNVTSSFNSRFSSSFKIRYEIQKLIQPIFVSVVQFITKTYSSHKWMEKFRIENVTVNVTSLLLKILGYISPRPRLLLIILNYYKLVIGLCVLVVFGH